MTINTIHGEMDESTLEKRVVVSDEQDAKVTAIEYWQCVHRSLVVDLKSKNLFSPQAQGFNHG